MIPFGLSSLMTVSMPIGRRTTKCLVPGASAIYLFNEGSGTVLRDFSGNANDGTFAAGENAPAWNAQGMALGGDDFATAAITQPLPTAVSVVLALTATTADGTLVRLLNKGDVNSGSPAAGFELCRMADNTAAFYVKGTTNIDSIASASTYLANTPRIITGTYDGARLAIYFDGALSASKTIVVGDITSASNVKIGTRATTATQGLTGTVYAAAIYPFALAPAQVAQNYAYIRALMDQRGVPRP